jgi:hypothetical protein
MKYIQDIGIEIPEDKAKISYVMTRELIRNMLRFDPQFNSGRHEHEDSYENVLGSKSWIRLSFDSSNSLDEIEIITGNIIVNGVTVSIDGNLNETLSELQKIGCEFIERDYGWTDFSKKIDIGDSGKNGSDSNRISWFYRASNLDHLKE